MEDFAQVFGVYPEGKYGKASYRNIAEVVSIETGETGISEFLRRFVFNALIGNGDMHLKNWSLIYPDRISAQLAPAYDFVSTLAYIPNDKLGLTFIDSKSFQSLTLEQFARFAAKAGLPEKLTLGTVRQTVADFRKAWADSDDLKLAAELRRAIDDHFDQSQSGNKMCVIERSIMRTNQVTHPQPARSEFFRRYVRCSDSFDTFLRLFHTKLPAT